MSSAGLWWGCGSVARQDVRREEKRLVATKNRNGDRNELGRSQTWEERGGGLDRRR